MSKKTAMTLSLSAALAAAALAAPAQADTPQARTLPQGYQLASTDKPADKHAHGGCGAHADKEKNADAKKGATDKLKNKGKQPAASKAAEGKCGEGKCGEGKCGGHAH